MKRLLFFINIIFVFMHQINFGMFLYQLQKKKTFFNTFLKHKSPRKQISPKQWFYLQRLFLKRNELLDAIRRNLNIADLDWLKFHNEFLNRQIYNELTLLQKPRNNVVHEIEKLENVIDIVKVACKELKINIDAIDIFSLDTYLEKINPEEQKEFDIKRVLGLAGCRINKCDGRCNIPTIVINENLLKTYKLDFDEDNEGLMWNTVSHELAHLICSHAPFNSMLKSLIKSNEIISSENKEKTAMLKKQLDRHIEKEANEIPLIISEKIFEEVQKYDPFYLCRETLFHLPKIKGGILWPDTKKIKEEVWD